MTAKNSHAEASEIHLKNEKFVQKKTMKKVCVTYTFVLLTYSHSFDNFHHFSHMEICQKTHI